MLPSGYASLAIYKQGQAAETLGVDLGRPCTRTAFRQDCRSWIYSTKDHLQDGSIEDHLAHLMGQFEGASQQFQQLRAGGHEFRVWVFVSLQEVNNAILVSTAFARWCAEIHADICVDIWERGLQSTMG